MEKHAAKSVFLRFHYKINPMKSHIKAIIIALLFVFMMFLQASAQKKPYNGIEFSKRNFVDTLKIKIWDGAIIIPVEINGETKNLMFDTGAERGFWIGEEEDWMTSSGDTTSLTDVKHVTKKKAFMTMPPIKMGNITIENYKVVVDNGLEDYVCDKIDGAFGYDLVVRGLSFKFDTKDSLMIVTDRKGFFSKEEKGQPTLKYKRYHKTRPQVWVNFPFLRIKLLFDSGAIGGDFDLPEHIMSIWEKENHELGRKMDEYTVLRDTTVFSSAGFFGRPNDTVPYRIFHCPEVEMGGITFNDVWVSTDKRTGKVGSSILKKNSLIIDGHKRQLVLLPHDGNMVQYYGNEDKRGVKFLLADKNDTLGVIKAVVRKDGDAYRKGVRTGDYLIRVNDVEINDYCTYFNLRNNVRANDDSPLRYVFRSPEGEIKEIDW